MPKTKTSASKKKVTKKKEVKVVKQVEEIKKEKPKKKKSIFKIVFLTIISLIIIVAGVYVIKLFAFTQSIGIKITPEDIVNPIKKDPQLLKDKSGKYTNALLVGIDTRNVKSNLKNTDTIMVVSFNHETGDISMVSIPRDFYVKVPNEGWNTKVNGLYAHGENLQKGNGMNYLKKEVENITGIDIQYYALVDLEGFKKIINAVGGIDVEVERTFTGFMQSGIPSHPYTYKTFKKGIVHMDGETALLYARFRKSTDEPLEAVDYARARRQQRVISATKAKILSTETLINPKKAVDILSAIQENVKLSEITTENIQAAVDIGLKLKEKKTGSYSFVLDPAFANYSLITNKGFNANGLSVLGPKAGVNNYTAIRAYIAKAIQYPQIYSENPRIYVYDSGAGSAKTKTVVNTLVGKYPYITIVNRGTLYKDKTGVVVYSNGFTNSVNIIAKNLNTTDTQKPKYITKDITSGGIVILVGK